MPVNAFLIDGNIMKKKNLMFFEGETLNFYVRSKRNPDLIKEFYSQSDILHPTLHAGSLWTTIKKIFKKGKNAINKTMEFIDSNPLTSAIKDIGFDYINQKTGINPSDYYDTAKNVLNMTPETAKNTLTTLSNTTKDFIKSKIAQPKNKPGSEKTYKDLLKYYYEDLTNTVPEYKPQIKQNFDLFSSGNEVAAGLNNKSFDTIKRNIPKMLLMAQGPRGGLIIPSHFKDVLNNKYQIKTLTIPKTLKELFEKVKNNQGNGRLYMGRGNENNKSTTSSTSKSTSRYQEILNKLKQNK